MRLRTNITLTVLDGCCYNDNSRLPILALPLRTGCAEFLFTGLVAPPRVLAIAAGRHLNLAIGTVGRCARSTRAQSLELASHIDAAHLLDGCLTSIGFLLLSHRQMLLLQLLSLAQVETEAFLPHAKFWLRLLHALLLLLSGSTHTT